MQFWITLMFMFLAIGAVNGHRQLTLNLKRTLQVGDEITIKGNGTRQWRGVIRLEDTRGVCNGRQRAMNPLVVYLRSRRGELNIGKKTGDTGCKDGKFSIKRKVYEIRHGSQYTIKILVPLSSNCGVRQRAGGVRTRIVGGNTSIAGNYPWQAAIRKKFATTWNPIIHICGGTIIDSCWILTAAHCGKRLSGQEEDYYIRVGDYDNSDHPTLRPDEDEQDLDIHKVFIHELYNRSTQNPVHDVSLIKLKDTAGTGSCAIFSSRFVTPACLPVVGTDDFATNRTCEISGWGASAYRQNVGDYPKILKQGDVRLRDFDECKSKFGNGTDGRPRVRDGMICAGGKADTCQGDSGGPLACQRNRAFPSSPFVIWGITSWGDKCALKEKPGVYTKVSDYMPWIMRTIAKNIDT